MIKRYGNLNNGAIFEPNIQLMYLIQAKQLASTGFKFLPLNFWKITWMRQKCQMSISLGKILY